MNSLGLFLNGRGSLFSQNIKGRAEMPLLSTCENWIQALSRLESRYGNVRPFDERVDRYRDITPYADNEVTVLVEKGNQVKGEGRSEEWRTNGSFIDLEDERGERAFLGVATACPLQRGEEVASSLCLQAELLLRTLWEKEISVLFDLTSWEDCRAGRAYRYLPTLPHNTFVISERCEVLCTEMQWWNSPSVGEITQGKYQVTLDEEHVFTFTRLGYANWKDMERVNLDDCKFFLNLLKDALRDGQGRLSSQALGHCSAGVGRTMTLFCALALCHIHESGKELSVMEVVCEMRQQRVQAVQTAGQLQLLYDLAQELLGDSAYRKMLTKDEEKWKELGKNGSFSSLV